MNQQPDLFDAPRRDSPPAEVRRFGRMDGISGMPRLNAYRMKLGAEDASLYDEGYRAAVAEIIAKKAR